MITHEATTKNNTIIVARTKPIGVLMNARQVASSLKLDMNQLIYGMPIGRGCGATRSKMLVWLLVVSWLYFR